MKLPPALLAAALALAVPMAHAQTQAAGLWEHSFTLKSQGGELEKAMADMQKQFAAMPPEQRQQIEQLMARRGVNIGAQATTVKACTSKDEASRPADPKLAGDCTQQAVQRSGNTMKFRFECTKPQRTSGEGEVTFTGDKAYTGRSTLTTEVNGKAQQVHTETAGKWLSADCGDVKPRALPAKPQALPVQ